MAERAEGNYTERELSHLNIKVKKMNEKHHSFVDDKQLSIENIVVDNDIIGTTSTGLPIHKSDDPGEMYKIDKNLIKKENWSSLLEETSIKDRRYLTKGATVDRVDKYGVPRYGWIENEVIARRILDTNNRPVILKNKTEYMALVEIKFNHRARGNGNLISHIIQPGETFFSPRSFENREKWEKLNSKK